MSSPVRVAIFGNGFARSVMLPCLRLVPAALPVGISSPNPTRTRETAREFGIEHTAADHKELLEKSRPDLVVVATPPHRHAEMALDALEAGCHVLCEKPTALNAAESRSMLDAALAHPGRLCHIDHELRLLPSRLALRRLVEQGELGSILRTEYTLHSWGRRGPSHPWNWWSDREQGGGALGALGSHAVDALRSFLGEVSEVRGRLSILTESRPDPATGEPRRVTADDAAEAWLRFEGGAEASVTISLLEAQRRHEILVNGSRACARLREQGDLEIARENGQWEKVPVTDSMPPSHELEIPDTDWSRAFLRFMTLLTARIQADRGEEPAKALPYNLELEDLRLAADFQDGHRNQMVLDAIRESSDNARWVPVGEQTPCG